MSQIMRVAGVTSPAALLSPRAAALLGVAIVVVAAVTPYLGTLAADFVFDDHILIAKNPMLRSAAEVPGYFTRGTWPTITIGGADTATYRPLVLLTFFAVYQVAGPHPSTFHAVNVALHAINAILVLLLLRQLGARDTVSALMGALVFAVHPVHVESVAWTSGLTDVLMTTFVLLTLWLYTRPSPAAYAGALATSALALLSKEPAAVIPVLALAHDGMLLRRVRWARVAGLAALVAVYLGLRRAVLGATVNAPHVSFDALLRAMDYALGYVNLALAPVAEGLYMAPPSRVVGVVGAAVALTIIAGVAVWGRRDRVVAFAAVLFLATLAPAVSLVFNVGATYAQRFLYLPSVAVALLVARVPLAGWRAPVAVIVALGLAATTVVGTRDWRDDGLILARAVRNTPDFHGAYWALALYHQNAGRRDDAARLYLEAARLAPPAQRAFAYNSLGLLHFAAADYTAAVDAFQSALAADRTRWDAVYNLGVTLSRLGRDAEARAHFATFVSGAPPERYASALADAQRRLAR
jgi:tetratricopeptide (TPR) repeat protein